MSRDSRPVKGKLLVYVGAKRIQSGCFSGGRWIDDAFVGVDIDTAETSSNVALSDALARLQSAVFDRWREEGTSKPVRPQAINFLVADLWLAAANVPWSDEMQVREAADRRARERLLGSGHEVDPMDHVVMDDSAYGKARLAMAYPGVLLSAAAAFASRIDARLESVLAVSAAAWVMAERRGSNTQAALALRDDGWLLLAQGSGHLSEVTVRRSNVVNPGDIATDPLTVLWQRMCMRDPQLAALIKPDVLDLSVERLEDLSGGAASESLLAAFQARLDVNGATRPLQLALLARGQRSVFDAVSTAPSTSLPRRLLAAAAVALAVGSAIQAWRVSEQTAQVLRGLDATRARDVALPVSRGWSRDELPRVQAVNAAIASLNLPIAALMGAMTPPPDLRVAVLAIDIAAPPNAAEGALSTIKIVAQAHTGQEMAKYTAFVADRKPFVSAYLLRHEIVESAAVERPYRFTVEAAWPMESGR